MSEKDVSAQDRSEGGKRFLVYGMFAFIIAILVAVFMSLYLALAPLDAVGVAIRTTLIVGVIAVIAAVVLYFVYTKVVLKE
jgi:hypothetical protein